MTTKSRRLSAALATTAIACAALLAPTTAHAADLDCESGHIVAPVATGLTVYDLDGRTPLGSLTAPVCAVTGEPTAPPVVNTAAPSFEVIYKGKHGLVEDFQVAAYPDVKVTDLTEFYAIPIKTEMPGSWMEELGGVSDNVHSTPTDGGPFASAPAEVAPAEGTVYRSSGDLDLSAVGRSALAGTVSWQPIEHRGVVAWMASQFLVPLPTSDDRLSEFTVEGSGYTLYSDPTAASAIRQVQPGEQFEATRSVAGWALTSEGEWLHSPSTAQPVETQKSGEIWAKVKEKSKDAWNAPKEKGKDLTAAAKEKVSDKRASSKALTFGAMITSSVLSAIAAAFAIVGLVVRRARGLALTTPAGIARTATAFVTAPVALVISLFAVAAAPFAWIWPPILAGAAALLSVAAVYVFAARLRGGHAHESTEALIAGLRSPAAIGAGLVTAVATIGVAAIAGLSWPAYVVAVLASIAAYAGFVLTAKRPPENADIHAEQADKPAGETVEESVEAEPEMAG